MNFSYWLNIEEDLLLVAETRGQVQQIIDLSHQSSFHIGFISPDYPLLAGLTVAENVALSCMYHQNLTLNQVMKRMDQALDALGAGPLLDRFPAALDDKEIRKVHFLRCLANNNSIVMVYRPQNRDLERLKEMIEAVEARMRLWVLCLEKHMTAYKTFQLKEISVSDH